MVEVDGPPQADPPSHVDLSKFRDGQDPRDTDIFVAVMGVTGAGESALISHLVPGVAGPEIGEAPSRCLYQPFSQLSSGLHCTRTSNHVKGLRIAWYTDIPTQTGKHFPSRYSGLDDTNMTDAVVLRHLADWLAFICSHDLRLHGILYLHCIRDIRMQGFSKKKLTMFNKLCGEIARHEKVLVTTMWENLKIQDQGKTIQEELRMRAVIQMGQEL